jgi:hypothetical protein
MPWADDTSAPESPTREAVDYAALGCDVTHSSMFSGELTPYGSAWSQLSFSPGPPVYSLFGISGVQPLGHERELLCGLPKAGDQ